MGGRGRGGDRATGRRNFSLQDEGCTLSGNEMRAAINETRSRDFKFFFLCMYNWYDVIDTHMPDQKLALKTAMFLLFTFTRCTVTEPLTSR